MKTYPAPFNEHGQIMVPGVHDSVIEEFRFIRNKIFEFKASSANCIVRYIILNGVFIIGFDHFLGGMIIDDIECISLNIDSLSNPSLDWMLEILGTGHYDNVGVRKIVENLINNNNGLILVVITSSYGGAVAAVCTEIRTDYEVI